MRVRIAFQITDKAVLLQNAEGPGQRLKLLNITPKHSGDTEAVVAMDMAEGAEEGEGILFLRAFGRYVFLVKVIFFLSICYTNSCT